MKSSSSELAWNHLPSLPNQIQSPRALRRSCNERKGRFGSSARTCDHTLYELGFPSSSRVQPIGYMEIGELAHSLGTLRCIGQLQVLRSTLALFRKLYFRHPSQTETLGKLLKRELVWFEDLVRMEVD